MSGGLSLHFGLYLVRYLDPTDIARARRVCKAWCSIFSSCALAHVALRVHFPLCREVHSPSHPLDYSTFNRISKRYAALKSGVPRQELRLPFGPSYNDTYVWTFAENLLVLQSSYYPRKVLTLVYLDARSESRRIITGKIVLGTAGEVVKVNVCRNMLLVELISDNDFQELLYRVDCFRVSLSPGSSGGVIATKVSSFDAFGFYDTDYRPVTDHSGKYYAAYSGCGAPGVLRIWDIETGKMVRSILASEFPQIPGFIVTCVLVIAKQGPDGPQQVVVAGNNRKLVFRPGWGQGAPQDWDFVTEVKAFPIEAGSPGWTRSIAHKGQQSISWLEAPQAIPFKVLRCPAGITTLDTPGALGYFGEEIGLTLCYRDSDAGNVYSSYHGIIPDHSPASGPDAPLAVEREFRMTFRGYLRCATFSLDFRSGLSLTTNATGREMHLENRRLIQHQLRVHSFYPSATPGVMGPDWETCLRSSEDRRETRGVFPVSRGPPYFDFHSPLMAVIGESELGTAFLDTSSGGVELVLVLWDDGFCGELPLGGRVLN